MTPTNRPDESLEHDARLANRATLLTLASLCSFLLALIAMPLTFQRTDATAPRVVASAPLAVGIGAGVLARAARGQLRALRDERESAPADGAADDRASHDGSSPASASSEDDVRAARDA